MGTFFSSSQKKKFSQKMANIFLPNKKKMEKKNCGRPTGHNDGHPLDRKQTFLCEQPYQKESLSSFTVEYIYTYSIYKAKLYYCASFYLYNFQTLQTIFEYSIIGQLPTMYLQSSNYHTVENIFHGIRNRDVEMLTGNTSFLTILP